MSVQQLLFAHTGDLFSVTNELENVFNFDAFGDSYQVASITSRAGCFGRDSNFNYENYVWFVVDDDLRKYTYSGGSWSLTSTTDSPLGTNILGCADNGTHVLLTDSTGNAALYNKSTNTFGSARAIGGGNAQGVSWDGTQWIITGYDIEERVYRVNADNTSTLGYSTILDSRRKRGNAYDFDLDRHWVFAGNSDDETFAAWDGSSFGTVQDWDDYDSNVTTAMTGSTTSDEGDIFITTAGEKFLVQFDGGTIAVRAKLTNIDKPIAAGHKVFLTPGTYSWTAPAGVHKICAVCVGGGGAGGNDSSHCGGSGGGLAWRNDMTVVPGTSYTVVVGAGGTGATNGVGQDGGDSYFNNSTTLKGFGGPGGGSGTSQSGGLFNTIPGINGGGGNGGGTTSRALQGHAGGGAGGYSGNGGNAVNNADGDDGAGGGGGAGQDGGGGAADAGGGGGGTGLYGEGNSGAGGTGGDGRDGYPGQGGSPAYGTGTNGTRGQQVGNGNGGFPGGGGGHRTNNTAGAGGGGAVRILWGSGRAFPSTNVGNSSN